MSKQNPNNTAPSVTRFILVPDATCGKHRRMRFMRPTLRQLSTRRRIINRSIALCGEQVERNPKVKLVLAYWKGQARSLEMYLNALKTFCQKTT